MTTKNFNVKKGITTGNVRLDANTGNIVGTNVNASSLVTTLDLEVTGNLRSNLRPNSNGVLSLGNATSRYKDLYLSNVVYVNTQSITANTTTVTITGNVELGNADTTTSLLGNLKVEKEANIAIVKTANLIANRANILTIETQTFTANEANVRILAANVITANTGNFVIINAANLNVSNTITANKIIVDLVEGNIFRANSANIKSIISDQITVNNQLIINSTTQATSTTTGSFVTAGGAAIGKDLYVGGSIHLANNNGGTTSKGIINYNDGVNSIDFGFNNT